MKTKTVTALVRGETGGHGEAGVRGEAGGRGEGDFSSASLPRHLLRGALGFGTIAGSVALVPFLGPATLLAAPLGLLALKGCPTCWAIGLAQTVSRGRLERACADGVCTLRRAGA
ncbi:hypothetical protein [Streptomyces sp. NPDC050504]|uniref:hypothetical protein n=1 Tax=Streptomyces sp. NPDC050504 TaxID=3365618 RepID=UPI0037AF1932